MRLLRLDLIAFGPFSGEKIDFGSRPGVHVVYGPNEAGKSSTLRALRAALFGFPHQTADDFRHAYGKLRVGATLEGADGIRLSFVRRKGAKNTLLTADGQSPLPDDALRPLLGNIREDEFCSMFSIGHADLRAGGQELLRGQGRLSELLFMTAAGLPRLRRIERALADEADALFKPRGEKPPINEALIQLQKLRAVQKEKSLPAAAYLRLIEALKQAKAQRAMTEEEISETRVVKSRLDRLSQALPTAARLKQYRLELDSFGDIPRLPADFTGKREALERESRKLAGQLEQLQSDLTQTEAELSGVSVPDDLLDEAVAIEALKDRLAIHRKASADTRSRLAEIAQLETDAKALLRSVRPNLGLEEAESLRLTRQEQATLRKLAARGDELTTAVRRHDADVRRLNEEIRHATQELERLGPEAPVEELRRAVKAASREGDLDSALAASEGEVIDLGRRIERELASLSLWYGTADELARQPVPSLATIERFEIAFAELDEEAGRLGERRVEAERSLRDTERSIEQAARGGRVPSDGELQESRRRRDAGWREVRRDLDGRGPGPDREAFLSRADGRPLPEAYESSVREADEVADRLRAEAERVERIAALELTRDEAARTLERLLQEDASLSRKRQSLSEEWIGHWRFLTSLPLTPREMREWSGRRGELMTLGESHRAATAKAEELCGKIDEHRRAIAEALDASGITGGPGPTGTRTSSSPQSVSRDGSLGALVDDADRLLAEWEAIAERRRTLRTNRERAERDLRAVEAAAATDRDELEAVRREWAIWMEKLGLPDSSKGDAALAVLEALADLFRALDMIAALRDRVAAMRSDAEGFAADVRDAAARLAPDLAGRPCEETAAALYARLVESRSTRDRLEKLAEAGERLARSIGEAARRVGEIDAELTVLCEQAGCRRPADLPAAEAQSAERRRVEALVDQAEEELRQRSGGRSVEDFLAEIDAENPDTIGLDLERIDARLDQLQDLRVESERIVTQHEEELSRLTGGADAVTAAEEAEAVAARLAADVERYAKLRFAAKLLCDARERYRQRAGNAVLARAGELFTTLTTGSFAGLESDFGDNDEPILVGVRREGGKVRTEGMSDGTADQLYLALRLAGVSAWLEEHEPLPFLVDDILVHFDDDRSAAALGALAALATKTQVILFSHHRHVVDLARATLPEGMLQIHRLGATDSNGDAPTALFDETETVPPNGRSTPSLF